MDSSEPVQPDPSGLRYAVVDTETTGVYTTDRVVEVALVTVASDGSVIDEWHSLVNPERDVGPTWLHGISAAMVAPAPRFDEIAGEVARRLNGAILVAHNAPFDARMLDAEFKRSGMAIDFGSVVCTLRETRCKLHVACEQHHIPLPGAHHALNDARAVAKLLAVLDLHSQHGAPVHVPGVPSTHDCCCPRNIDLALTQAPPNWFAGQSVGLDHCTAEVGLLNYLEVLDLAMADLCLDGDERVALDELAREMGLAEADIKRAHRRWMDDFIAQACDDGIVDEAEYAQLSSAELSLGLDAGYVDRRTIRERMSSAQIPVPSGGVCFTGQAVDAAGNLVPRRELEQHAVTLGLTPIPGVTKKCALLVAADAMSQSGKAAKARRLGIPVASCQDFMAASPDGHLKVTIV